MPANTVMSMILRSFHLPRQVDEALFAVAQNSKLSKAAVLRHFVMEGLKRYDQHVKTGHNGPFIKELSSEEKSFNEAEDRSVRGSVRSLTSAAP